MSWYLIIKFLHILAVTCTIGGMFTRQLARGIAKKSKDLEEIAALTRAATRMDRALIIPASNIMIAMGIILAVMQNWPIFGFLQGSTQNWLLASNMLLIIMVALIPGVFIPHNKKVEALLKSAISEGKITSELSAALADNRNDMAHYVEEFIVIVVAGLMVLKPF